MRRTVALLFILLWGAFPALAEPVFLINMISLRAEHEKKLNDFLKATTPLQNQHGLKFLFRFRVVDHTLVGNVDFMPIETIVLRADSKKGLKSYLASSEYIELRSEVSGITQNFSQLQGVATETIGLKYIPNVPMAAMLLGSTMSPPTNASLTISIQRITHLKGTRSKFLKTIKSVQIHAVSFDDNPMGYMPNSDTKGSALGLIGELMR